MDSKIMHKEIRKISNISSLPVLVYCVLYVVLLRYALFYLFEFLRRSFNINATGNLEVFAQYIVAYLIIIPLGMLFFHLFKKKDERIRLKGIFSKPQKGALWITKWLVISFSVDMAASLLVGVIAIIVKQTIGVNLRGLESIFAGASFVTVPTCLVDALSMLVFAPIFEELLFRGLVFKNDEKCGQVFAIITSSLLFGLWHRTFEQLIVGFVIGVFSCYLYIRTKSIIPSMMLHFINNAKSFLITYLVGEINIDEIALDIGRGVKNDIVPIALLMLTVVAMFVLIIIGTILLIREVKRYGRNVKFEKSKFKISALKKSVVYFTAPVTILTYVYLIYALVHRAVLML